MFKYLTTLLSTILLLGITSVAFAVQTADFSWLPNAETNLAGYKIYYTTIGPGQYDKSIDVGNPSTVEGTVQGSITGLEDGATYYFAATAYDSDGFESDYSTEVVWTAPTGPVVGDIDPATMMFTFPDSEIYVGTLFIGTTDKDITLTWPTVAGATVYEYRLYDLNKKTFVRTGATITSAITFRLPATGLYRLDIKADNMLDWVSAPARLSGWPAGAGPIDIF